MTVRMDKFKVGDSVTWADDNYATLTDGRKTCGDGPFTVIKVIDREENLEPYADQTLWESMGHTQHIIVDGAFSAYPENRPTEYSGAFFKKVD